MKHDGQDLGFSYRTRRDSAVAVFHHGRPAATLRGRAAANFIAEVQGCPESDAQQLMARLTGNYKRGNERQAGEHPRNRR